MCEASVSTGPRTARALRQRCDSSFDLLTGSTRRPSPSICLPRSARTCSLDDHPHSLVEWEIFWYVIPALRVKLLSGFWNFALTERASDLGVRKLLFSESDQLFSSSHASYHFLRQDFHFDGIQQQASDIASIYPRGCFSP